MLRLHPSSSSGMLRRTSVPAWPVWTVVYKVEVTGATPMEWQLEYDSEQLRRLGVTVDDIYRAVQNHYRRVNFWDECRRHRPWGTPLDSSGLGARRQCRAFRCIGHPCDNREGKLLRLDELVSVTHAEAAPAELLSYQRVELHLPVRYRGGERQPVEPGCSR